MLFIVNFADPLKMPRIIIIISILCSIFCSCRKENEIGLNTQPANDLVSAFFSDSSTVQSYVIPDDSLITSSNSVIMAGSYVDPIFGKTSTSIYTQLNLFNDAGPLDLSNGTGYAIQLDSAVLTLAYTSALSDGRKFYGTLDPQTFNVYALANGTTVPLMVPDSPYYSGRTFPLGTLIGSKTFVASPDSNVTLGGNSYRILNPVYPYTIVYPPHLRIRLNNDWVNKNIIAENLTSNLSSSGAFHDYFPGICIQPGNSHPLQGNGKGAIFYFNPYAANTGLVLYYRINTSSPALGDTLTYTFQINGNSACFTHYDHNNYAGTPIASSLTNASVASLVTSNPPIAPMNPGLIYLQSMAGVRTLITFPFLNNWVKKGVIEVNQAQLLVNVVPSTVTPNYDACPQIYLVAVDSSYRTYYFPIDVNDGGISLYGGTFDPTTNQYAINITRQIQQILTGQKKYYGFYLLAGGSNLNAQRVELYGATKINNKLRLRLSYSKLH